MTHLEYKQKFQFIFKLFYKTQLDKNYINKLFICLKNIWLREKYFLKNKLVIKVSSQGQQDG